MKLTEEQLHMLETPCLVIDVEQVRHNIRQMQQEADAAGCTLRPHIKTHKMPFFARMQIEEGARGITCAKVSEAEVMADGGVDDIFIAYPVIGQCRIRRAIALHKRMKRLILGVDSLSGAHMLAQAAEEAGVRLEVRLEIDTGAGRSGIPPLRAPELARAVAEMPSLLLTGIYTFKSLVWQGRPTADWQLAAMEEGQMMADAAEAIRAAGVSIQDISAGSSPTGAAVAKTGMVNEIRPGTYVFKDLLLCSENAAVPEDIAVRYAATVVSANHPGYAVIDGGTKTFPCDIQPGTAPAFMNGFAAVEGRPDLALSRMNEEHGILTAGEGQTNLNPGDILTLLPVHVCTAINQQNSVYLLENGALRRQKVDARGMLL